MNPAAVSVSGTYYIKATTNSTPACTDIEPVTVTVNPFAEQPFAEYIPPACDQNTFSIVVGSALKPILAGGKYIVLDKNGASIPGISPATTALNPYLATAADVSANRITFSNIPAGSGFQVHLINSSGCPSSAFTCPNTATATTIRAIQSAKAPESSEEVKKTEMAAYPIPFSDRTTLEFKSVNDEDYVINLYDLKGTMIKQLKSGKAKAGEITRVEVDGRGMAESMYLARKVSKTGVSTVKLLKKK
ncbi:T9SS type A sorting domain-containing protein [Adhaeribacter rhizoryzae]|uniref:T9SS type A sorting domain-containing protein n=1 Tax=Adhaeribacter rhizoryzae TaxID=2607907 RepID=A0A5M6DL98_9BACT|nr:T9SS type A sorting domain-containing protein [Adhaeribacter rhizoryzae]